jgi:hypothetical protein
MLLRSALLKLEYFGDFFEGQLMLDALAVCYGRLLRRVVAITAPAACAGILEQSMGAGNRVGIGLFRQATQAGEISGIGQRYNHNSIRILYEHNKLQNG